MSTTLNLYDYRYYIEGAYIAILQRHLSTSEDPYAATEDWFVTPTVADTTAIYLRFTKALTLPTDETSDLGLSKDLAMACLYYVKARLAEDQNPRLADKYMSEFYKYVSRERQRTQPDPFAVTSNYMGAVR
jgi:hypothetical protein